jgi:hypothetical protein
MYFLASNNATESEALVQPKGDDKILLETISCSEGHLGYIFGTNIDLVIVRAEINFGEHLGSR